MGREDFYGRNLLDTMTRKNAKTRDSCFVRINQVAGTAFATQ
jgi:hypothetical protein